MWRNLQRIKGQLWQNSYLVFLAEAQLCVVGAILVEEQRGGSVTYKRPNGKLVKIEIDKKKLKT